jgi:hypothetical protein
MSKKARNYKPSDIKRLFAFSGNQCAEPSCNKSMIAEDGKVVIGEVCHISAASKDGPRYRADIDDDKRRSFDNLILLCNEHHKMVDNEDNLINYPENLLLSWKKDHQITFLNKPIEITDNMVSKSIQQIVENSNGIANQLNVTGNSSNIKIKNTVNNNYTNLHQEEEEQIIIQEIFDNAIKLSKIDSISVKYKDNGKLTHTLKKIQINFKDKNHENEVRRYFTNSFNKKNSIERYLASLDSELQTDLENHIFSKYSHLKDNKNSLEILRELFIVYLPSSEKNNPVYANMAQAYVLLFFEDCTIFKKTEEEINRQTDLFSDL